MDKVITSLAIQLELSKEDIITAYNNFWLYIRETVKTLPLDQDLTDEEFNKLRPNFNIVGLGKLYCNYKTIKKNRLKYAKHKENPAIK
jgi:hypothetical protein